MRILGAHLDPPTAAASGIVIITGVDEITKRYCRCIPGALGRLVSFRQGILLLVQELFYGVRRLLFGHHEQLTEHYY